MKKTIQWMLMLLLLAALATSQACKKSDSAEDPNDASLRLKTEKASGYAASSIPNLCAAVRGSLTLFLASSADAELHSGLSYDPATGWWTIQLSLSNNQTAQAKVRFIDGNGNIIKYPDGSVNRLETEGSGSGPKGAFTWDLELKQFSLFSSSSYFTVNGDGTATIDGVTVKWSVTNLQIEKHDGNFYPESGVMTVDYSGLQIKITFSGSETVTVTYSYKGVSYTFKINLLTGEIIR